MTGNPFWVVGIDDLSVRLVFVAVPEVKRANNRLHLDLLPFEANQSEELARIESLGARIVDDRRHLEPGGWVVMKDPEGNEFCLEGGSS